MKYTELLSLAKPYYPAEGSHGWNHIEDVLSSAKAMARIRKQRWSPEMTAAAVFHDSGLYINGTDKDEVREGHEDRGADIAGKRLQGLFTEEQLKRIKAAIREHRASYKGPYTSYLSDLISSADRGAPDMKSKLLRSYAYHMEQGETPEQAYKGIAEFLPTKYGPNGYARIPVYYRALYAKQLKEYQKQMSELTADKVRTAIEGQS